VGSRNKRQADSWCSGDQSGTHSAYVGGTAFLSSVSFVRDGLVLDFPDCKSQILAPHVVSLWSATVHLFMRKTIQRLPQAPTSRFPSVVFPLLLSYAPPAVLFEIEHGSIDEERGCCSHFKSTLDWRSWCCGVSRIRKLRGHGTCRVVEAWIRTCTRLHRECGIPKTMFGLQYDCFWSSCCEKPCMKTPIFLVCGAGSRFLIDHFFCYGLLHSKRSVASWCSKSPHGWTCGVVRCSQNVEGYATWYGEEKRRLASMEVPGRHMLKWWYT